MSHVTSRPSTVTPPARPATPSRRGRSGRTTALLLLASTALGGAGCVSIRPYAEVAAALPPDSLLTVDGTRVHIDQRGAGFPLLLLHGFGASTLLWEPVLPVLAQERRAVAIDLHGFGWTERPQDPAAYTLEGQERMILGVADQLGFRQFDLAGHSYGGAIALFIASRHPERVRSLILVDNAMPEYAALRREKRYGNRTLAKLYIRMLGLRSTRVRVGLEASYADDTKVTRDLVRAYYDRLRVQGVEDAFYGLTAPNGEPPVELDLATIRQPTLVVWGTDDELIRATDAQSTSAKLPNGRFVALPACGHIPTSECPEEFLAAVTPFLAETDATRGLSATKR
jgi:pimeloyl-ACP methyl ester carboxylesterase